MKTIEVVAAIIHQDNKILATQRGYGDYKGWWEFPGGKMEEGETEEQAIIREIREELDVEITEDNTELASKCEKIIIAVETPQFKDLLNEIKPFLKENCHIMYTCSGLEFENVEKTFILVE